MCSGKINCSGTVCLKPSIKARLFTAQDTTCVMQLSQPFYTHTHTHTYGDRERESKRGKERKRRREGERDYIQGEVLFGLKPYSVEVLFFT